MFKQNNKSNNLKVFNKKTKCNKINKINNHNKKLNIKKKITIINQVIKITIAQTILKKIIII